MVSGRFPLPTNDCLGQLDSGHVPAVSVGSHVEFTDHTSGRRDAFTLVEPFEAKVTEGRLSARSPVARALLGHRAGEVVTVHTPRGERQLEVIAVD
jgi:transcription elongation GreA/GreB family factor